MKRTKEFRREKKYKKLSRCRKFEREVGYFFGGYEFKNKRNRWEFNPDNCYCIDAKKYSSKKFFKKESNMSIRNWHKREIRNKLEEASCCNNQDCKKLYDYWWTIC